MEALGNPEDNQELVVGFWWEQLPTEDHTKDGISRAFAWILAALLKGGQTRVVIASPVWGERPLRAMLADHGVDSDRIEIVTSRRSLPLFVRLMRWQKRRSAAPPRPGWNTRLRAWVVSVGQRLLELGPVQRAITSLVSTSSIVVVLLLAPLVFLAGAALLLVRVVLFPFRLMGRAVDRVATSIKAALRRRWDAVFLDYIAMRDRAIRREYLVLSKKIAKRSEVACWFVAWPWAKEAGLVPRPIVTVLWDFVYAHFPASFPALAVSSLEPNYDEMLRRADAVVTNSEYVLQETAVGYFGVDPAAARVVRISPPSYAENLKKLQQSSDTSRRAASALVHDYLREQSNGDDPGSEQDAYLREFPYDEVTFLFNSSELRPHKNSLNLIRAFELLLRRRLLPIKLLLTGSLDRTPSVSSQVSARNLTQDVVAIPRVPSEVHAALYHLSALTVVPTLFEGGLPFPLFESVSMGTPVVLSSIPMVLEVVPEELRQRMLFDPFDPEDMARTIHWALENGDALLAEQQELVETIYRETFSKAPDLYRELFAQLARGSARGAGQGRFGAEAVKSQ